MSIESEQNEKKIPCPKCGELMRADARCCIKCGTVNAAYETNKLVLDSTQEAINDYKAGKTELIIAHKKNQQVGLANNTGNREFSFYVTLFLYLFCVIVIGLSTYSSGVTSFDTLIISSFPFLLMFISIVFLYIYSIELVFMKCNKPWWAGLVPIYNMLVLAEITFSNKYLGLICLVPIIGQLFTLAMFYKLGEKFKYSGLLTALLSIIYMPIIGYGDHLYEGKVFVSSGDELSLEKDYRRKKLFFGILIFLLLVGLVLFVMGNMGKIRKADKTISGSYYKLASVRALKYVKKAISEDRIDCGLDTYNNGQGVYYIKFGDLGDYVHLPLYMSRDPITAYVKVDNNKNPQEFYVSMTDGKYGFKETLEANINSDIVTTYPELESISDYCKVIK